MWIWCCVLVWARGREFRLLCVSRCSGIHCDDIYIQASNVTKSIFRHPAWRHHDDSALPALWPRPSRPYFRPVTNRLNRTLLCCMIMPILSTTMSENLGCLVRQEGRNRRNGRYSIMKSGRVARAKQMRVGIGDRRRQAVRGVGQGTTGARNLWIGFLWSLLV